MRKPPYNRTAHLRSLGGRQFTHFGKGRHFNDDLYHGLVAPTLLSNLLTETWQHDRKRVIGPSCKQFTVEDVTYINVSMIKFGVDFKNARDHAKFAIGKSASSPYVCIGDINREVRSLKSLKVFILDSIQKGKCHDFYESTKISDCGNRTVVNGETFAKIFFFLICSICANGLSQCLS